MAGSRRSYLQVASADSGPQCAPDLLHIHWQLQELKIWVQRQSYKELLSPWCIFCPNCNFPSEVSHTLFDCLLQHGLRCIYWNAHHHPHAHFLALTSGTNMEKEEKKDTGRWQSAASTAYRNILPEMFAFITIKCICLHLFSGICYIFTFSGIIEIVRKFKQKRDVHLASVCVSTMSDKSAHMSNSPLNGHQIIPGY